MVAMRISLAERLAMLRPINLLLILSHNNIPCMSCLCDGLGTRCLGHVMTAQQMGNLRQLHS
jgi:hypothetical protein